MIVKKFHDLSFWKRAKTEETAKSAEKQFFCGPGGSFWRPGEAFLTPRGVVRHNGPPQRHDGAGGAGVRWGVARGSNFSPQRHNGRSSVTTDPPLDVVFVFAITLATKLGILSSLYRFDRHQTY